MTRPDIMPNNSKTTIKLLIVAFITISLIAQSGCIGGKKEKALYFDLGPGGIETKNVNGSWALEVLNLGATNVGTENIESWGMTMKLLKNGEVIDEREVGPWQGVPPDSMRVFKVESLKENDPYLLEMENPEPGEYKIRLLAYDDRNQEKVGEADIPFEIKPE